MKVWQKCEKFNQKSSQNVVKYPASAMIWCWFSHKGVGYLKFVEKTIKSTYYQDVLHDGLLPNFEEQRPDEMRFLVRFGVMS